MDRVVAELVVSPMPENLNQLYNKRRPANSGALWILTLCRDRRILTQATGSDRESRTRTEIHRSSQRPAPPPLGCHKDAGIAAKPFGSS
jgi:hypothetical protein